MTSKSTSWKDFAVPEDLPILNIPPEERTITSYNDTYSTQQFRTIPQGLNESYMSALGYDIRDIKIKLEGFTSINADLKAEIKVSNANSQRIMENVSNLTHSTETNANNITDIKNNFSEFKNETNLNFKSMTNEFSKIRTEAKSDFDGAKAETALNFEKITTKFETVNTKFETVNTQIQGLETKFSDKLKGNLIWTFGIIIAVGSAVGTINYRNNSQLEVQFTMLEKRVNESTININEKLNTLLENQKSSNHNATARNKQEKSISITKAEMQAVIIKAIRENEESKEIEIIARQTNN